MTERPPKPRVSSRPAPPERTGSDTSLRSPRHVLVVDDDEVDRAAVARALRGTAFVVRGVETAAEALARIGVDPVDIILLDNHLPDGNAADFLDVLTRREIYLPVVLLTGSRDPEVVAEAMRRGAVDYVSKDGLHAERLTRALTMALRVGDAEAQAERARASIEQQAARLVRKSERTIGLQRCTSVAELVRCAAEAFAHVFECQAIVALTVSGEELCERSGACDQSGEPSVIALVLERLPVRGTVQLFSRLEGADEARLAELLARSVEQVLESLLLLARAEESAAARRDMAAIVSHDLRTPLQAFALGTKLLSKQVDAAGAGIVARMERNIASMERLIRDILDTTRLDDGVFTLTLGEIDAGNIVRAVVDELAPLAEFEEIALSHEVDVPPDQGAIRGDSTRLRQALANFVSNAVKHTPRDGTIRVTARAEEGSIVFEVIDSGPGVPAEVVPHIFDRLVRGPSGRALGLGLGLHIARGIAEAHGGSVGVETAEGQGSRFWMRVPRQGPCAAD